MNPYNSIATLLTANNLSLFENLYIFKPLDACIDSMRLWVCECCTWYVICGLVFNWVTHLNPTVSVRNTYIYISHQTVRTCSTRSIVVCLAQQVRRFHKSTHISQKHNVTLCITNAHSKKTTNVPNKKCHWTSQLLQHHLSLIDVACSLCYLSNGLLHYSVTILYAGTTPSFLLYGITVLTNILVI